MSKSYENNCVGCTMGCGHCGRNHEEIYLCDEENCNDYADYITEDYGDFCEECFEKLVNELWDELSTTSKAEILGIKFNKIE